MTGICLVGFALPSSELLDGVSGKACSGDCSGCTNTCTVSVVSGWIIVALLHQGEEGGAEALGREWPPYLKWKRGDELFKQ